MNKQSSWWPIWVPKAQPLQFSLGITLSKEQTRQTLKSMWREDSSGTKEVVNLVTSPVLLGSLPPIAHAVGLPMSTCSEDSKRWKKKRNTRGRLTTPIFFPLSHSFTNYFISDSHERFWLERLGSSPRSLQLRCKQDILQQKNSHAMELSPHLKGLPCDAATITSTYSNTVKA